MSVFFVGHSHHEKRLWRQRELPSARQLIHHFGLTDFALWTEARYTRNPALADFFAPFQDFPAAFEHFPAGSILAPSLPAVDTRLSIDRTAAGFPQ
ncbi:MAG TPA: hypothetical protein ENK89_00850 [Desulfobulbaceae bacterium]|nr:hypothetical protein [Desulfobulbaceae bacterium]